MPYTEVDDRRIEYRMIPGVAPATLVFLHEGLGSVALWRDFPEKVARRLGMPALVYSRFGYGQSDGLRGKRQVDFMHREANDVLPALLAKLGIGEPLLIGHSDGASIALIHAASHPEVRGLVLMAPHVFVEPVCVESIARIRETYMRSSDLRQRLSKYHARVDDAFLGWADVWLDPAFLGWSIEDLVGSVTQPMLLIQGRDDEYGTLEQLDRIEARAKGPVQRLVLDRCGHSPYRDQETAVIEAVVGFVRRLGR